MKIPAPIYRHIEFELYGFDKTKAELNELREDILIGSGGGSDLGTTIMSGTTSDTTGKKAERLLTSQAIIQTMKTVNAIERALSRLGDNHRAVFQLKYRQQLPWQQVCEEIPIAERTYFLLRKEMVYLIGLELGWIKRL